MTAPQPAAPQLLALACATPHPKSPELLCAVVGCPGDVHEADDGNRWTTSEETRDEPA